MGDNAMFPFEASPGSGNVFANKWQYGWLVPKSLSIRFISTDVTNDPIEEELRLPISMISRLTHFRHHEATKIRLVWIGVGLPNFREIMGMKLAALFFHFSLEWI